MKNAICKGGCKKGSCNGDCKRPLPEKKSKKKANLIAKNPELKGAIFHSQYYLVGASIKKVRKERHLNKKELGRMAGIKKSQVARIETDLAAARFDSIIKVFMALDMKMNFLFELPDQTVMLR